MTKEQFIVEKLSEDNVHRAVRLNFTPDLVEETICGIKFKVGKILTSKNGCHRYYFKSEEDGFKCDKWWIKIIFYDDQYWIVNKELSDDQLEELYKGCLKRKKLYEILKVGTEALAKELNLKWTPYLDSYDFYDEICIKVDSQFIKDTLTYNNQYDHRIDHGIDIDLNENTSLEIIKTNLLNLNGLIISNLQIVRNKLLDEIKGIDDYLK